MESTSIILLAVRATALVSKSIVIVSEIFLMKNRIGIFALGIVVIIFADPQNILQRMVSNLRYEMEKIKTNADFREVDYVDLGKMSNHDLINEWVKCMQSLVNSGHRAIIIIDALHKIQYKEKIAKVSKHYINAYNFVT